MISGHSLDAVTKLQGPHGILWPYKDVDAYWESRCEELQAIAFTFHRPVWAWAQVQNIILTRSQRFIVLLLSDVSWWWIFRMNHFRLCLWTHVNKLVISPLLHFSLTHAVAVALGFFSCQSIEVLQTWTWFLFAPTSPLGTAVALGQKMDGGWRREFFPATAGGWDTSERQEAPIKPRRVSKKKIRSRALLECVLSTAAPWEIRRLSSRSDLLQREWLTEFVLSR